MTPPTRRPTIDTGAPSRPEAARSAVGSSSQRSTSRAGNAPLAPITEALAQGAGALKIPDGVAIVLAVSGGPDSTALLHGAAALAPERGWRLTVAHLDHALRSSSADEAAAVAASAARLGLTVEVRRMDVAALAASEHRSLEDAGRQARYRFLEEVARARGSEALIATAHTADDAAETILMRLARGSGLRGLRGIPARRGRIVRPLLHARRAVLRAALDAAGIAYTTDPSNADPAHARNRVRAELLPQLERLNPAAVEALRRFGRLAADDDDLLDAIAATELAQRRDTADASIDWHRPPARALGRRMLRLAIGEPAPSAERIEALLDAAEGPRGGVVIELGGGRQGSVRERRIRLA
jgi:tRNA(Ile)-lysidine synthase